MAKHGGMAAPTPLAAPAAADAPTPEGSGVSVASTPSPTPSPKPLSLDSSSAVDAEDLLDGEDHEEAATESNPEDPNPDAQDEVNPEDQDPDGETDPDADDEVPEVVEDENGKRLVSASHLERALKQRAKAKQAEREALSRAEAAELQATELKAQLTAGMDKPALTDSPLLRLAPKGIDPDNAEHLTTLEAHAQEWLDWCEENPVGGEVEGEEWDTKAVVQQRRWAQAVLKAIPQHRDFQAQFTAERAKVKAQNPRLFEAGTPENKAYQTLRGKLLNFGASADQDALIAELVEYRKMKEEIANGIADYPRVPKKPTAAKPAEADKPKPKPVRVTTRPVGLVKPSSTISGRGSVSERLAAATAPTDVEDLID